MTAENTFGADFARDARHFRRKTVQLIDHRVDGFFKLEDFAADGNGDLFRQVAAGNCRGDFGNVADLACQVAGHRVDVVGQVFPRTGNAGHLRLPAELSFSADFTGDACHFASEGVQLIDHRVDGIFEF